MAPKHVRRSTTKWIKETGKSLKTAIMLRKKFRDDLRRAAERFDGHQLCQLLEKLDKPGALPKVQQKKMFLEGLNLFLEKASGLRRKGYQEFAGELPTLIIKSRTLSVRQKMAFAFRLGTQAREGGAKLSIDKNAWGERVVKDRRNKRAKKKKRTRKKKK